jgi:DNA-binding transcriptional MerR regulator
VSGAGDLFDDDKDNAAFRTIGEVANALGIKPHVLRYWEEQFPMLKPVKRSGQRRYYRPEDVALLQTIDRLLNREGFTIKGAVRALRSGQAGEDATPVAAAAVEAKTGSAQNAELAAKLRAIRGRLAEALV